MDSEMCIRDRRMFGRLIATTASDKGTVHMNNITTTHSMPEGPQPTVAAATQAVNPPYTVQYVMPAPQQSGGCNGQRGRGRGARGCGWSLHWNPYHGPPVMTTPYGFIPPYTAPLVRPPMRLNRRSWTHQRHSSSHRWRRRFSRKPEDKAMRPHQPRRASQGVEAGVLS